MDERSVESVVELEYEQAKEELLDRIRKLLSSSRTDGFKPGCTGMTGITSDACGHLFCCPQCW